MHLDIRVASSLPCEIIGVGGNALSKGGLADVIGKGVYVVLEIGRRAVGAETTIGEGVRCAEVGWGIAVAEF